METLQRAFSFDETDLNVNRLGYASDAQIRRLKRQRGCARLFLLPFLGSGCLFTLVFGIIGLSFLAVAGLYLIQNPNSLVDLVGRLVDGNVRELFIVVLGGGLTLFILLVTFVGLPIYVLRLFRRDQQDGRVVTLAGPFLLRQSHDIDYSDQLILNQQTFNLTSAQYRALLPYRDRPITVYFFPRLKRIIAIEI